MFMLVQSIHWDVHVGYIGSQTICCLPLCFAIATSAYLHANSVTSTQLAFSFDVGNLSEQRDVGLMRLVLSEYWAIIIRYLDKLAYFRNTVG